jgi:hypothetical protein
MVFQSNWRRGAVAAGTGVGVFFGNSTSLEVRIKEKFLSRDGKSMPKGRKENAARPHPPRLVHRQKPFLARKRQSGPRHRQSPFLSVNRDRPLFCRQTVRTINNILRINIKSLRMTDGGSDALFGLLVASLKRHGIKHFFITPKSSLQYK